MGSQQFDIICGTLLGDGFLERNGRYARLVIDHFTKQKDYVIWLASMLASLRPVLKEQVRLDSRNGKTYLHIVLRSHTNPILDQYLDLFYENGKKNIPTCLPIILSPLMLAIWIMDDGYKRNDCNAMRINT